MFLRMIAAALSTVPLSGPALAYDATRASRYMSPDMYRPNVDGVIFRGTGSSGPIGRTSADPDASLPPGRVGRSVFEALQGTTFYLRPFLVKPDGTTDTACASDQLANINAAILAAPAGAELALPPGCIAVSGTIQLNGRRLRGVGRALAATELRYTNNSGPAIKMMGDAASVSRIFFKNKDLNGNTITATAAVAVQMADGISNPRGQMVERIKAEGFQDQIDIQSGEFWTADNLDLHNAARYAMRVRNGFHADSGDGVIANSVLYADGPIGDTAIRQESGGGLRLVGVKTLQFNRSFVLAIADGGGTSNLMIDGSNSFENPRSSEAIKLGRIEGGTTGKVGNISIEAQVTGSIGVYPGVENVRLAPITRDTNYGIIIAGGDNISVLPGTSLLRILQQGVVIQDPATNVRIGDFLCAGCKTKVADQRVTGAGRIAIAEQRPISLPTPASSAAFVPFYEIALAPYRGLRLSVEVEGLMQNVGAVNSVADVLLIHNGTTVTAPTPVVAQKDAGAAPVELQFDTTTTPGAVRIGARVPATYSGGSLAGSITLKVDGRIASFKELP